MSQPTSSQRSRGLAEYDSDCRAIVRSAKTLGRLVADVEVRDRQDFEAQLRSDLTALLPLLLFAMHSRVPLRGVSPDTLS